MLKIIQANWPTSKKIHAFTTTRHGGISTGAYSQLNLGDHVGDMPEHVATNRQILMHSQHLPQTPLWLQQVHGCTVVCPSDEPQAADASYSVKPNEVLAIMTADCLPILLTNTAETKIAAIHAGWRGLAYGVIQATVHAAFTEQDSVLAWLGPAIGPTAFEVGSEVRAQFLQIAPNLTTCFLPAKDRFLANIYDLARYFLQTLGINAIYGGEYCTVSNPDDFFSYRRDGTTGRLATLIWRT